MEKATKIQRAFDWTVYLLLVLVPLAVYPDIVLMFELPKLAIFRSGVLILLFLGYLLVLQKGELRVPDVFGKSLMRWLLLGGIVVLGVSSVLSVAPMQSFWGSYFRGQGLFTFGHYLLFFMLLCLFFKKWERGFVALAVGVGLACVVGVLQKFGLLLWGFSLEEISLGRVIGTLGHPNYLAYLAVLVFFPLLGRFRKWWQVGILVAFVGAALFLTESRGALLGLVAGGLMMMFFWRKKWGAIALAMILALGGVFLANDYLRENFVLTRSVESRLSIWESSMEVISDSPLFGHGMETFGLVIQKYLQPEWFGLEKFGSVPDKAHNVVIEILVNFGFLGLLVFVFGVFVIWQMGRNERWILAALMAGLIMNLFGFFVTSHFVVLAFLLGFIACSSSSGLIRREVKMARSAKIFSVSLLGFFVVCLILLNNVFAVLADGYALKGRYLEAASWNPYESRYHYLASVQLREAGELELAGDYLQRAGKFVNFSDPHFYLLEGRLLDSLDSEESFLKGLELGPIYPPLLLELGSFYVERGNCEEGLEILEKYVDLDEAWKDPDRKEYSLFYKHNPGFDEVFEVMERC